MTRFLCALGAITVTGATGCILPSNPCGPNQVEYEQLFAGCVCKDGAVPDEENTGCVFCGDNEVVSGNECVCEDGFERNADGECEMSMGGGGDGGTGEPSGQDMPCSSSADCAGTDATFCQTLQQPNVCLVQNCVSGENSCSAGRECCDLSSVPIGGLDTAGGLCVPEGSCMSPGVVVP